MFLCMLLARQGSWLLPTRFTGDSPVVWPLVIPWVLVAAVLMGKWNGQRLAVAAGGCGSEMEYELGPCFLLSCPEAVKKLGVQASI